MQEGVFTLKKILKKSQKFSEKNLITLRPNNEVSAILWDQVIGKKSKFNLKAGDPLKKNIFSYIFPLL